jgi:hypothetical protein
MQDFTDCARRFKLRYMDRLSYPAMESEPALENERNQQEGEFFHRLVQQAFLGLDPERLGRLANSSNLARWWENFVEHRPSLDGYTIHLEYSLSAPLGEMRMVAKYDLVAIRDGNAVIYDWKAYQRRPSNEWLAARWQTRVYPALLSRSGGFLVGAEDIPPENIQMIYWFPDFPAEPAVFQYSRDQYRRDWEALERLAGEIPLAEDFPQTEDLGKCRFCTYRSYCDRGIGAPQEAERLEEWGLEEPFDLDFGQIGEIAF